MRELSRLFGSSGVRGLINEDLTTFLAAQIGTAISTYSKAKKALVGRDTRTSGFMLENALTSGLISAGAAVTSVGVVPTPVLAFLTKQSRADVGVMITASHNPPEYNGIKVFDADGIAYDEKSQEEIEKIVETKQYCLSDWRRVGEAEKAEDTQVYVHEIMRSVKLRKKWKIIVDPGCGATFDVAPRVFKNMGCKVIAVNAQPDGFFPARSPEPNKDSLKSLATMVTNIGADIAVAYDGDGDRVAFIDERGNITDFDRVLAAYTGYIAKKRGGGLVVTNVEASMSVEKMAQRHGAKVLRTRVGDIYLSSAIREKNAIFGGEPCGAWIHPQFQYCPDGILSSVLLLKALEDDDKGLAEMVEDTPTFQTLRENVRCSNEAKDEAVRKFGEDFSCVFTQPKDISRVDGIRLSFEDGWILVRASGTEPLVRLTVEGESLKTAQTIMKKGLALVGNALEE